MRIDGKAAVVTGGLSGIGRTTVDTLAAAGGYVWVGDINEAQGAEAVAALRERAQKADLIRLDVTNLENQLPRRLSGLRPLSLTKKCLHQEWNLPIKQTIETEAQVLCTQTADFTRADNAFGAKQKPRLAGN